jgi:hypothetical protein
MQMDPTTFLSTNCATSSGIRGNQMASLQIITSGTPSPAKLLAADLLQKLHPQVKGKFEFWTDPDLSKKLNLVVGEEVQFKTDGDSIILCDLR